jgi:hypothetical protein
MTGRRGASVTEYMLLISVILVAMVAAAYVFVPIFGEGVELVALDVEALLRGEGNDAVASREDAGSSDCPYTFDPRTGRYHDTSDGGYLMVSFADASDAGCGQ